jgi:hypothetical protein
MARRSAGISGSAVLLGTAGLYLAYAGVKDVPIIEGLRDIVRGKVPTARAEHKPYAPTGPASAGVDVASSAAGTGGKQGGCAGPLGLCGYAAFGYTVMKLQFPSINAGGYRPTGSVPGSRHPLGLAVDWPTRNNAVAQQIIAAFKKTPGARTWIWNRQIASANTGWRITGYDGPSPHTDHVHTDWN